MIWNTETKRLEFEDGTPVGAKSLNEARVQRGMPVRKAHLQETAECVERRELEAEQGAKRTVRKRGRKNLFQRHHDNLVKPRPSLAFGSYDSFGRTYGSGLRALEAYHE